MSSKRIRYLVENVLILTQPIDEFCLQNLSRQWHDYIRGCIGRRSIAAGPIDDDFVSFAVELLVRQERVGVVEWNVAAGAIAWAVGRKHWRWCVAGHLNEWRWAVMIAMKLRWREIFGRLQCKLGRFRVRWCRRWGGNIVFLINFNFNYGFGYQRWLIDFLLMRLFHVLVNRCTLVVFNFDWATILVKWKSWKLTRVRNLLQK